MSCKNRTQFTSKKKTIKTNWRYYFLVSFHSKIKIRWSRPPRLRFNILYDCMHLPFLSQRLYWFNRGLKLKTAHDVIARRRRRPRRSFLPSLCFFFSFTATNYIINYPADKTYIIYQKNWARNNLLKIVILEMYFFYCWVIILLLLKSNCMFWFLFCFLFTNSMLGGVESTRGRYCIMTSLRPRERFFYIAWKIVNSFTRLQ